MQSQSYLYQYAVGCIQPFKTCGVAVVGCGIERFMGIPDHLLAKALIITELFSNVKLIVFNQFIGQENYYSFKNIALDALGKGLAICSLQYFGILQNPLVATVVLTRAGISFTHIPAEMISRFVKKSLMNREKNGERFSN